MSLLHQKILFDMEQDRLYKEEHLRLYPLKETKQAIVFVDFETDKLIPTMQLVNFTTYRETNTHAAYTVINYRKPYQP